MGLTRIESKQRLHTRKQSKKMRLDWRAFPNYDGINFIVGNELPPAPEPPPGDDPPPPPPPGDDPCDDDAVDVVVAPKPKRRRKAKPAE